jgi:hypothetical protein
LAFRTCFGIDFFGFERYGHERLRLQFCCILWLFHWYQHERVFEMLVSMYEVRKAKPMPELREMDFLGCGYGCHTKQNLIFCMDTKPNDLHAVQVVWIQDSIDHAV